MGESLKKGVRLISLDAFRGLTIAGMILVNKPGSWDHVYSPLLHAEWHGWTPTDLIFPSFLFIVGVAMTFSFSRHKEVINKSLLHRKILRRSLIIFLLGLFLNAFPGFDLTELRVAGVLQRIAIVYLLAAMIVLHSRIILQATLAGGILILYWAMMAWIPVPGHGSGVLTPDGNLAAYLDSQLLPGRMWQGTWDPEGILSTLPSVSTTLIGVLTGHWVRSGRNRSEIAAGMIVFGWIAIGLAGLWDTWFPINKNIWTSSFVLLTAGVALQFLGLCYWLIEIKGKKSWFHPAVVFGMNPITVYVLSGMLMDLLYVIPAGSDSLQAWIFDRAFLSWASPANASLSFAICYVVLWVLIMDVFYRKRVFIKI